MGGFWRVASANALKKTSRQLRLDTGTGMLIGVLVVIVAVLALAFFGSEGSWRDEFLSRTIWLVIAIVAFPFIFLINLFKAPGELFNELSKRISILEETKNPRFSLEFDPMSGVETLPVGNSVRTVNGRVISTVKHRDTVIRVFVKNLCNEELTGLKAYITELFEISDSGEIMDVGFKSTLLLAWSSNWRLPWRKDDNSVEVFECSIPPEAKSAFYVAKQFGMEDGALMTNEHPFENHRIFNKGKHYRAVIKVSSPGALTKTIVLGIGRDESGRFTASYSGDIAPSPAARIRPIPSEGLAKILD